jgi:hypothetical protein
LKLPTQPPSASGSLDPMVGGWMSVVALTAFQPTETISPRNKKQMKRSPEEFRLKKFESLFRQRTQVAGENADKTTKSNHPWPLNDLGPMSGPSRQVIVPARQVSRPAQQGCGNTFTPKIRLFAAKNIGKAERWPRGTMVEGQAGVLPS